MEWWSRAWSDVGSLRNVSAWLQGLSIGLAFVSGFLQIGKLFVDRREKALSAELQNPTRQAIRTGTCTVDILAESPEDVNTHYMDRGGYVAFGRGTEALMVLAGGDSFARQTGQGAVAWRGVFALDANDVSIGKPIRSLLETEYVQIAFLKLTPASVIKGGRVVVTLNSSVRLELSVPPQGMVAQHIRIDGVSESLAQALK